MAKEEEAPQQPSEPIVEPKATDEEAALHASDSKIHHTLGKGTSEPVEIDGDELKPTDKKGPDPS